MRFTRSLLALGATASLASTSQASVPVQQVQQDALIHHASPSLSSPFSGSHHNNNRHAALARAQEQPAFQRRTATNVDSHAPERRQKQDFSADNTPAVPDFPTEADQYTWVELAYTDPIAASKAVLMNNAMVLNSTLTANQYAINNDETQQRPPWTNLTFIPIGNAAQDAVGGWMGLPQQLGFELVNWTIVENAVMPYYITSGYNPETVKRAVITWPGKPRDCWKYGAYTMSGLYAAGQNATNENVPAENIPSNDSVIIISPAFLNEDDLNAGAVESNWLAFHGSRWQSGYQAVHPQPMNGTITSYDILDNFTDWLFDKQNFPNLKSVSIIGHSMGAQATQRYALLKKAKPYDDNIRYWIGNPGSWAWLSPDRPVNNNATCDPTYDQWGYGLAGNLTKMTRYGRKQVEASKEAVVNRFFSRRVHIALGLLDNGFGDTHCEAQRQGATHLGRGSQFIQEIADVTNGVWPEKFTLSYMANTSHSDFNMFTANQSLWHIFQEDFDVRYPDLTNLSNPGDVAKKPPGTKSFATPKHKLMAIALLGGSVGFIFLAFALLPCLFPANSRNWEGTEWETETKKMKPI
ncbi:unnamed protein product [Tilletia controversa]|nr:unnamed protein product [Tilletia controversa]CAD6979427.1 unnamed protein product [Tilletia controversa]